LFIFDARQIQVRQRIFLKKEAKTLALWRVARITTNPLKSKSFLVLFCKKERFLDHAAATALMNMARISAMPGDWHDCSA
jgi:hypothetical protein